MTDPGSESWRDEQAQSLLDFGRHGVRTDGRFGWLTDEGGLDPSQARPLYHAARMTHVWALASLRTGNTEYAQIATAGLASLEDFADDAHGGWHASLDPAGRVNDPNKANYAHAHVLLAASTATAANLPGAADLLARAADVIVTRFWSEAEQASVESWDAAWTKSEAYRGANSNMHSVEAYLAAGDVTGDPAWHARALSIADVIINRHARSNGWRIPEHFTVDWTPLHDYNQDRPDDRFRPFGTTPGHSFEWARLLLTLEASLPDAPPWLLETATAVFTTAVADGWAADGNPGFVYTIDRDGRTVVAARLHWVACEAVLAAHALHARTGDPAYADEARQWWRHIDDHFIDHSHGGWWQELSPQLSPTHTVWPGKPDLYHCYQALLFPSLPLAPCAAASLAEGAAGRCQRPAVTSYGPSTYGPNRAAHPAVVFVGGPPASGKTTLGHALGKALGAVVLDLDVATGPLTALVMELVGARDLSDARAAALTRDRRYETLLDLAAAVTRAGVPAVLVAPFTVESTTVGWAAATGHVAGATTRLVWLTVPPTELARRLMARGAARDSGKRQDPEAWLASLPAEPPSAPHFAVDATQPLARMVAVVLDDLDRSRRAR